MLSNPIIRSVLTVALPLVIAVGCAAPASDAGSESSQLQVSDDPACKAEGVKLDTAASHAVSNATYDAVIEATTETCGTTFHTTGPSHLDPSRLIRLGSNTKTYVAVVTLGLVGEGKIALDGRLDASWPDAPSAVASVTVRQLLQHTSGIYNFTDTQAFFDSMTADPKRNVPPSELVGWALAQPPYFAPGAGWQYSNTNYILLGMMLEHVGGAPIAKLIRDRILTPNHLTETFLEGSEPVVGELAPGFDENGDDLTHVYDLSVAWSAGAMVATPSDAARFVELLGRGELLAPALQAEMTKGVDIPESPQDGWKYGLGVILLSPSVTAGAGPGIGHGGDIWGYHTARFYFPEKHLTIFGAVDSDKGDGMSVVNVALEGLFAPPAPPVPPVRAERPAPSMRRAFPPLH